MSKSVILKKINQILYNNPINPYVKEQEKLEAALKLLDIKTEKPHKFWKTQPVRQTQSDEFINECIEIKNIDNIKTEPYQIPDGFEWYVMDINDPEEMKKLYELLKLNYVEDEDCLFRFNYSINFLKWALSPPNWKRDWHLCVRGIKKKNLLGFISAIPQNVCIHKQKIESVEVNFLCVHRKLRSKHMAPILIKEITRRVNLSGIFQAFYTAGIRLPTPIAKCTYYHRSLNCAKLSDVKFYCITKNMNLRRLIKLNRLPEQNDSRFVPMGTDHTPQAHELLMNYLKNKNLYPNYNLDEFNYWFLPQESIVYSYIVKKDDKITDFISYYLVQSSVLNNERYDTLTAAYLFFVINDTLSLNDLVKEALISAKKNGADAFNALDCMENDQFFKELKFGKGDGNLHYYAFNWNCSYIDKQNVGMILL
ncbi:hypothetical protein A3Q56_00260 [Intoshia linei]|uniref:Glycylpeptide N-tetradecanoyltransferase n=1 Tax=Intoshia linei TaxID=1819745 RepID=A0A177BCD5_9BILA|nr:hypothetical protein A3Q56_00260 [Intoshia linei]